MYRISLPPSEESMLIKLVNLSYNTIKDAFEHLVGKLGDLTNQIREKLTREIIWNMQ